MEVLKIFDAYSLRARLFPAVIACAPALAALALLISWKSFELSNAIASLGVLVLLVAIADFARARGRGVEKKLYAEHGGMPSITLFRRTDSTIDAGSKERYRQFLAGKIGAAVPTSEEEATDRKAGDAFYDQCGVWLRSNTRDTKRFPLVFSENVTYGFRRNLLRLKWIGLGLNAAVVVACLILLWNDAWKVDTGFGRRTAVVLVVASFHALYMLMAVRNASVWDAARAYGRELILACESFVSGSDGLAKTPTARRRAAPKPKGKTTQP